ncbi:DUF4435 domain-containing protein [Terasakiella sp.]|uniref:DUF4435 domain-containing protein n=1 Tax=Terasakiella sp. TaxID=2034861 RepID=UPI003AA8C46D
MVQYSSDEIIAAAYLSRTSNDILVFVEDTACMNMYVKLIKNILGDHIQLNEVFQMQGKTNVIKACKSLNRVPGKAHLFIVDGDLERLHKGRLTRHKELYWINGYCSENILLEENAFIKVMSSWMNNTSQNEIANTIDFTNQIEKIENAFGDLFILYAIEMRLKTGLQTVKHSMHHLCNIIDTIPNPCENKIRQRYNSLKADIIAKSSEEKFENAKQTVLEYLEKSNLTPIQFISGKDYIFPILFLHVVKKCGYKGKKDTLKADLAERISLEKDAGLKNAIKRTYRASQSAS